MQEMIVGYSVRAHSDVPPPAQRRSIVGTNITGYWSVDVGVWPECLLIQNGAEVDFTHLIDTSEDSWARYQDLSIWLDQVNSWLSQYPVVTGLTPTVIAVELIGRRLTYTNEFPPNCTIEPIGGIPNSLNDSWQLAGYDVANLWLNSYIFPEDDFTAITLDIANSIDFTDRGLIVKKEDALLLALTMSAKEDVLPEPGLVYGVYTLQNTNL